MAQLPTIPIGPIEYLPGFRMDLTPFGSEWQFESFVRHDVAWDGRDSSGSTTSSGNYFDVISSQDHSETGTCIPLR